MKWLYISTMLFFFFATANAQRCRLSDLGGKGIAYANVYHKDLTFGLISDWNGYFHLPEDLSPETELHISCIGYQDTSVQIQRLLTDSPCRVQLQPQAYELPGAEVEAAAYDWDDRRLGYTTRLPLNQYGFGNTPSQSGFEVGVLLENDRVCYLEKIGFVRSVLPVDSMLVELNVYEVADGKPATPLHRKRQLKWIDKSDGKKVELDVSSSGIRVEGDFVVGIETLNGGLLLNAKLKRKPAAFHKGADGRWDKLERLQPAVYARLRCR
mgnify:CR=1 FL=1